MSEKKYDKIVLAYSGGLDTSVLIPWLKENYGADIIAVSVDVGQGSELDGLEEKALASGAQKLYIENLKDEFVNDFIFPAVKAEAAYENYLLGTSLARPLIAKRLVEIAREEGADAIVHGCTGKGNDQVRFELTIQALAPDLDIIAPWRFWELDSRQKEIEYARAHNVPLKIDEKTNYSKDKNLWHLSHEGLDLEDPANEAPYNRDGFLELSQSVEKAPDEPEVISIRFEQGIPVALNDEVLGGVELIERLNEVGGKHGIGQLDLIENRLVGMKSRGVYEAPAATILYQAHHKLEELTLDRQMRHFKDQIGAKLGELAYDGLWYTPLRKAISAFVDESQKPVSGEVVLKLYKGNMIPLSVSSPFSLYNNAMATFDADDVYDQADSAGFIHLFGLPLKIRALNDLDLQTQTNGELSFPDLED